MNDYISREAAKKEIVEFWEVMPELKHCKENQLKRINSVPSADVRPVVHGKWEPIYISEDGGRSTYFIHRQCGCEARTKSSFCPNCGAQMDGGDAK